MNNHNGFDDMVKKFDKLSNVSEKLTLDVLEEAAEFFVKVLKPNIPISLRNRRHLQESLKIKIEGDTVVVYFDDNSFYWRFVENGTSKQRAQNFVKSTYAQNKNKIEKIMLSKIVKKMEV
ncbi:HK97 gp10 family phage protein [Listeria monocytogenes]|nr:HK97 gp10 family phage protein [Listeria monocytogenes]EAG8714021.1 HK97 gp10 family phage protein [Listeria monocytogenes]EAG8732392.1 HK97 gp10 family phage protein [Listeria monocytogenes]